MYDKSKHSKCQNRDNCTGPGCKANTGKTRSDKLPVTQREHVLRSIEKMKQEQNRAMLNLVIEASKR